MPMVTYTFDTNLSAGATSQYQNFNFNSMVGFNGKVLFASDSGLFQSGCIDDDGTDISAYFEPIVSDFGVSNQKRIRFMYLGFVADGKFGVEISADDGTKEQYEITPTLAGPRHQRYRLAINRTVQGRYFRIRFYNIDGSDFSIDSVKILINSRSEGFR